MHQSPQKHFAGRREKYADAELTDMQAERRLHRETSPKARKFSPLEDEQPRSAFAASSSRARHQRPGKAGSAMAALAVS